MANINKINSEYEQLLLNSSSEELTELYKVMNAKFISTIGTVENGFNYDKEEQEKLKGIINNLNSILKRKYYTSEVDVTTKFNSLLKEYLKLQSEYILKEVYSTLSFILNLKQTIYSNIKTIEYILIDLGFNYYANELSSNIGFLNATIELAVKEVDVNIDIFNNLTLNVLDNPSVFYEELEPMKDLIKSNLAEIEELISYYENLKLNPFEKVIEIELNTIEEVYSGRPIIIKHEKEQILNNVPEYDFSKMELILPEVNVPEGAVE